MMNRQLLLAAVLTCGVAIRPAPAQSVPFGSDPVAQTVDPAAEALATTVNRTFGLIDSRLETIPAPATLDGPFVTEIQLDGVPYLLELGPYSVRTADYVLLVQGDDGTLVPHEPGPIRTLRGSVTQLEGSRVAGSLLPEGLLLKIDLPGGDVFWIEPVASKVPEAAAGLHVVYHSDDIATSGGECGNALTEAPAEEDSGRSTFGGLACGTGLCFAEMANDADFEFYQDHGSSVALVEDRVNDVVNAMNLEYEADVDIVHVISAIVVRSSMVADPYTNISGSLSLVNAVQAEWENNLDFIPRDITQLFTGINVSGSTIGRAFTIGGVCTSGAYSFSQSDCCGNFGCTTDLHAHENGHVWNGIHCSPCGTMTTPLACANFFSAFSQDRIELHRDSRICLATGGGPALPFFDPFPDGSFDPANWSEVNGNAAVVAAGAGGPSNPPSAPNAARLDGLDSLITQPMNLSPQNAPDGALVTYSYQRTGLGDSPEAGEDLLVEYLNNVNDWVLLNSHAGGGPDMLDFEEVTFLLDEDSGKGDALHSFFRLRFRVQNGTSTDDWFIDDVAVDAELGTTALPFFDFVPENPPQNPVNPALWTGIDGVQASTRGANEPTGTLSLNLNGATQGGQNIRSAIMDTTGLSDGVLSYWYEAGGTDNPPDAGDDLFVEYLNANAQWVELAAHLGSGASMNNYVFHLIVLPEAAKHDGFRIRFRSTSDAFPADDDDWFVDNICVGDQAFCLDPVECGVAAECNDGIGCTIDDCVDGFCIHTENNALCNDGVGCTIDECDSLGGGCQNTPSSSLCNDGIFCTSDFCDAVSDCQHTGIDDLCNDDNPCTDDTCAAGSGCTFTPNDLCGGVVMETEAQDSGCSDDSLAVCSVFVSLPDPDDRLLSIGFTDITTNDPDGFFQFPAGMGGSNTAPQQVLIDLFPDLACDSFVTIGLQAVAAGGEDCTTLDPDFDATGFNSGGPVSGGWYCNNPPGGQGDAVNYPDNRLLVAQFVVNTGFVVSGTTTIFVGDGMIEIPGVFECLPGCSEDLNGDGVVNAADLAQLLGAWGPNPGSTSDLNGDGTVNAADLAQLLGAWGPC